LKRGTENRAASLIVMTHHHEPPSAELNSRPVPRFCARCDKPADQDPRLSVCPRCGDRLITQGYCPVCEGYWRLPVATACPKHDLPLDAVGPPSPLLDAGDKPFRWVTVRRFTDSLAAEAPRIRLEAEGIPTFVEGQRMGSPAMYHVATGGVRLKVPDSLASDARIILSQTWSATAAELGIEDDLETDGEEFSPELSDAIPAVGRSLRFEGLFFLAVGLPSLIALYLLVRHWSDH
jgi:Putative prokaryotic signal transducing protein